MHIPGTGILSHQHEEHDVSRRISRLPSLRSPSLTKSQQAGPAPVVIPDVFTLSPHAHLLTLPSRNRMVPAAPQVDTRHTSVPDTIMYSPRPSQEQWEALALEAQEIFGLDAALVLAVIRAESDFDHRAISHAGAEGAMQLMAGTQEELGLIDPFDPRANIYAGSQYLMEQLQRFRSPELALAAYNAGPGNVQKYGGIPPFKETQSFVRRVMRYWKGD